MSRTVSSLTALLAAVTIGCGEDSTTPEADECDVADLNLTVEIGTAVTLDWTPACPVALLLIEPVGAPDAWQIRSTNWDDDAASPSTAWNTISPPVLYGSTPPGAEAEDYIGPDPLLLGTDYTFSVFRVSETGLAANGIPFTYN